MSIEACALCNRQLLPNVCNIQELRGRWVLVCDHCQALADKDLTAHRRRHGGGPRARDWVYLALLLGFLGASIFFMVAAR